MSEAGPGQGAALYPSLCLRRGARPREKPELSSGRSGPLIASWIRVRKLHWTHLRAFDQSPRKLQGSGMLDGAPLERAAQLTFVRY